MTVTASPMLRAGTLDELRQRGVVVVRGADRPIAVFYNDGVPRAIDNRCPHMGFPMSRGSCRDGMITCHWHHARFDAASGCTFDLFADDVSAYEVEVRGEEVFVAPQPRSPAGGHKAHALRRLREGMAMSIGLVSAKSILALRAARVPEADLLREAALFGVTHRDGWAGGLTALAAMGNLVTLRDAQGAPLLEPDTAYVALYQGVRRSAADCAGQVPRRERQTLEAELPLDRLTAWLHHWTRVRHRDGAERTLLTAIHGGATPRQLAEMLFGTAVQRAYADGGHLLDFCNKACELLDHIGWDHAGAVLPALMGQLVSARGGEESDAWHHPIDLVALSRRAAEAPPAAPMRGAAKPRHGSIAADAERLLDDDPEAALAALVEIAHGSAGLEGAAAAVEYAAALRVARFGTANEVSDWFSALHSFSYCHAVRQAIARCPSAALWPGVVHGAISVYLNRFLNVPPAKLPPRTDPAAGAEPRDPAALLTAFLEALDAQQQVGRAAALVARYLDLGHPLGPLVNTLTWAALREDADFHTLQMLEAGVQACRASGGGEQGRVLLIAVARYLAAHSPTQRAQWQTARIALRLHRGEEVYEEEP